MNLQKRFEECDITVRSYSGRGMYGSRCLGIVGSNSECRQAVVSVIQEMYREVVDAAYSGLDDEEACSMLDDKHEEAADMAELLLNWTMDSMGLDVIMYWPAIEYEESEGDCECPIDPDSDECIKDCKHCVHREE